MIVFGSCPWAVKSGLKTWHDWYDIKYVQISPQTTRISWWGALYTYVIHYLTIRVNTLDIQLRLAYPFASFHSQILNRIHKCWLLNLRCNYPHLLDMNYFDRLVVCGMLLPCYKFSCYSRLPKHFSHELFAMPRSKAIKGNMKALLLFWTNPCTSPANWYGRNVITSKSSSCFAPGLHNTNEWHEPTEATVIAPAVFPCHVGNLVIKTSPSKSCVTENYSREVNGGQLMRKNVMLVKMLFKYFFYILKPSSPSLFIAILKMQERSHCLILTIYFSSPFGGTGWS